MEDEEFIKLQEKKQDGVIYIFEKSAEKGQVKEKTYKNRIRVRIWQLFPSVCCLLINIPYGMMLAWPSPTYPRYLLPSSPIPITLDQSAMIAGFLMIGMTVATPLSSVRCVGPKNSMVAGTLLMSIGWIIMWQATNIYFVLASRFVTGFGYGFCNAKIKVYISEMCDTDLSKILIGLTIPGMCLGVITMFSYGPFVKLADVSIIAAIITSAIFSLVVFLPNTPKEFIRSENIKYAKEVIKSVNPKADVQEEIKRMKQELEAKDASLGYMEILKDKHLRVQFTKVGLLTFFQQFTGLPSTIIYAQILFTQSKVPYAVYIAIVYVITYFLANIFGIFISPKYNKRRILLASNFLVSIAIVLKILVIYFKINELYWDYTSVIVMLFYIIVHTIGLGNLPFTLIADYFPANCRKTVTQFFVMLHSMSALVITKIFQVLMGTFGVHVPFYLFFSVSLVSLLFIFFVITDGNEKEKNVSANNVT